LASYTSRNRYTSHITVQGYLNWSLYHLPTKNPLALYLGISNIYMHLPTIVGWFSHFCENEQFWFVHRVVRTSLIISKKFLCFYENRLDYKKITWKNFSWSSSYQFSQMSEQLMIFNNFHKSIIEFILLKQWGVQCPLKIFFNLVP
jgi:hypothetical protein